MACQWAGIILIPCKPTCTTGCVQMSTHSADICCSRKMSRKLGTTPRCAPPTPVPTSLGRSFSHPCCGGRALPPNYLPIFELLASTPEFAHWLAPTPAASQSKVLAFQTKAAGWRIWQTSLNSAIITGLRPGLLECEQQGFIHFDSSFFTYSTIPHIVENIFCIIFSASP